MIPIPEELLEQIERGNILLFIGEGIARDAASRAVLDQLTAQLAARCGLEAETYTFPEAAQAYEDDKRRHALIQFIRDQLEALGDEPQQAHRLIAGLTDCNVLTTTCLDRRLERAFQEAKRPLDVIIGNLDVAFEDERKARLYKLRGSLERAESLVLTEDDHETFFEDQTSISVVLQGYLARKTILFVGYDLADPHFQRLYRKVTVPLDDFARRAYAFGEALPQRVCRWCERHGIEVIEADVAAFLEALTGRLAARARPAPAVPPRPVEEPAALLPERPYKLLDYYETKDAAIFFGRRQETQTLSSLIHAHRLVLLYGASGVGKTSLLLAGVGPRLERAEPPYETIYVRALENPALVIRRVVRRRLPKADLPEDGSLVDFLNAATKALDRTLVIVLDQFEEFFIRLSPQFRAAFIAELGALYDARDVPIKVVLSLREDWLASVNEIRKRIPEVFYIDMQLLPMTRDQARQAITAPVERLGVSYEPALVERLLGDLMGSDGKAVMPPQLQLVCNALYERARVEGRRSIVMTDYEILGKAQGVLQKYLEGELARLGSDERALARGVLEELVTSQGTKAVKASGELALALDVDISDVESVLEKLVRARLLRMLEREDSGIAYELAHEYLIRKISLSPEAQLRKQTEELIQQDVENWSRFGLLIDSDRFSLLNKHREKIHLAPKQAAFMLRCAIRHNIEVKYWVDTLNVEDAAEIVKKILNEKEKWVRRSDRINALHAALHLPSEIYEPLLYEQALAKDHVLAQEARVLLRGLRPESTVAHFYTLWESGSEEERKEAIRVLSELDSPAATKVLGKILCSQSTDSRIECIEIIGQAVPNDAQRLLAQSAICDSSSTVREKAQQYLHKAPGTGTAREVFELCVPRYQNYTQYFRDAWSDGSDGALTIRSIKRIVTFVGSVSQAIERPDMLIHNRALLVACKFLGKDSVDSLVEIIEAELQHRPSMWESLAGWLFLTPLFFFLLSILTQLRFLYVPSLVCAVLPPTMLVMLLVTHRGSIRVQNKILATLLQPIRGFGSQEKNYDFLLAQSFPLSLVFVAWLLDIIVSLIPSGFILSDALRWILRLAGDTAYILYLALVVFFVYHGILAKYSSRNISWFTSGPGRSIRRYTAIKLVQHWSLDVLLASLERFASQPDRAFPIEVTRLVSKRIGSGKEAQPLRSFLDKMLKEVFQTTDHPETWYTVGTMLKRDYGEFVEEIAQQEMQRSGSGLKPKAVMLLRKPRDPVFVRLLKPVLIYLSVLICSITSIYYGLIIFPRQVVWTLHTRESKPNILWVGGKTGLYRVTLNGEDLGPSVDLVLEENIKAVACSLTEDTCFVAIGGPRIGVLTNGAVKWLDPPISDLTSEIKVIWITYNGVGPLHLWIQAGSQLFMSADMGVTWDEPFDNVAITQLAPLGEHRAMVVTTQMEPQSAQSIVYATTDSGKTWEETQVGLTDYTWLEAGNSTEQTGKLRSPDPSAQKMKYYVLPGSNPPMVLLAHAEKGQLWHSIQGLIWQKVFVPEESLGQRACGAWFSPPTVEVYGETTLLYRSYALLDGEQGIYFSWDRGLTWERIPINGSTTILSTVFHWHPSCGDAWQQIPDKLSSWLRSGSADGH